MYIFRRTAEILSAQLKILGATSSLSINYVSMSKDMGKRVPQLYYIKMKMSHDLDFIAIGVAMAKQWKTMPVNRSLVNWKSGGGGIGYIGGPI